MSSSDVKAETCADGASIAADVTREERTVLVVGIITMKYFLR